MTGRPVRTSDYPRHMVNAIGRINTYVAGMDAAAFPQDARTQDAVAGLPHTERAEPRLRGYRSGNSLEYRSE